jgi:glycosyltransferase involved in cell wall biosynthesis
VSETTVDAFPSPNGYVFSEMSVSSMTETIVRAVEDFNNAARLSELRKNALLQRNGWPSRLADYEAVYDSQRRGSTGSLAGASKPNNRS